MISDIKFLFMPHYWIMLEKVNIHWDKKLNKMLDNPIFEFKSDYRTTLNNIVLWTGNYPYSYGAPWLMETDYKLRPKRRTILRLKKAIDKWQNDRLNEIINGL